MKIEKVPKKSPHFFKQQIHARQKKKCKKIEAKMYRPPRGRSILFSEKLRGFQRKNCRFFAEEKQAKFDTQTSRPVGSEKQCARKEKAEIRAKISPKKLILKFGG